jgi:hypothetical protein
MTRNDRPLAGMWHNDHGSELMLEVGKDGELSGRFRPGDGPGSDRTFPVKGFTAGSLIAFTAGFGEVGSLASWVGHRVDDDGGPVLDTLWHLTLEQPHAHRPDERWKTIWSGADRFRPGHAPPRSGERSSERPPLPPLWWR